jgi:hypothetical protein
MVEETKIRMKIFGLNIDQHPIIKTTGIFAQNGNIYFPRSKPSLAASRSRWIVRASSGTSLLPLRESRVLM